MSDQNAKIVQLLLAIKECNEQKIATERRYAQKLNELKLELAKACGHTRISRDWVWGKCDNCGFTELIAWFSFANSILAVSDRIERCECWLLDRKGVELDG